MTHIKIKLVCPPVPDYISMELPPRPRQEGLNFQKGLDIADLEDEQLKEIAEEWAKELLQKALLRRTQRKLDTTKPRI